MPKELLLEDICKKKAKEVGDSLPKLMHAIKSEFKEIQFKGIEFITMSVCFHVSPTSISRPSMSIDIWCSALSSEQQVTTDKSKTDSRYFSVPYSKDDLASIFWLIHYWKKDIVENHLSKLKTMPAKTLFDKDNER